MKIDAILTYLATTFMVGAAISLFQHSRLDMVFSLLALISTNADLIYLRNLLERCRNGEKP